MKLFDYTQRRSLAILLPLLLILLLLVVVVEMSKQPLLIEQPSEQSVVLREFDPNTFEYEQLRDAGVPVDVAVGIIRWRRYGKQYRIKEELAQVSGMTDSLYALLEPYIYIADSLAPSPARREYNDVNAEPDKSYTQHRRADKHFVPTTFLIDTVSAHYLTNWGLSIRQAGVVLRYRDASGGIFSAEQLRRCYVIDAELAERMIPYVVFSPKDSLPSTSSLRDKVNTAQTTSPEHTLIELNSADSATLVALYGIGPKSAHHIIRYRELLGGYHSVGQLRELKWVTEENFNHFSAKIFCDSCKISKIDVNFAGPKELERHPYISSRALRRIVKQRQLKGGWSRIEEMIEQNILTDDEAKRLAPYLRFGPRATE